MATTTGGKRNYQNPSREVIEIDQIRGNTIEALKYAGSDHSKELGYFVKNVIECFDLLSNDGLGDFNAYSRADKTLFF